LAFRNSAYGEKFHLKKLIWYNENMELTFWGVRGSMPSPSENTVKYGGNTPCISVNFNDHHHLILDAGTGIYQFGHSLNHNKKPISILLSHLHWDHIQGLPFFPPFYEKNQNINILFNDTNNHLEHMINDQMDGVRFPLTKADMSSQPSFITSNIEEYFQNLGIKLTMFINNHPGLTYAYKIEYQGKKFIYSTDHELHDPTNHDENYEKYRLFCEDVELLIIDTQYHFDSEYNNKTGWGHSYLPYVLEFSQQAHINKLVMFHHDPLRTDQELDDAQVLCEKWCKEKGTSTQFLIAKEGLILNL